MRGSLWTVALAAIGAVVLVRGASVAQPDSSASSTDAVASVLTTVSPFVSQLLAVAAIGAIVILAIRAP